MKAGRLFLAALLSTSLASLPLSAASRFALVVGNGAYAGDIPSLPNPPNDAADLEAALSRLGWNVTLVLDGRRRDILGALDAFGAALKADPGSTALFFFAGHGLQMDGKDYLLPLGEIFENASDVRYSGILADDVLAKIEEGSPSRALMILDACRDDPLGKAKTRSILKSRGIAVVPALETPGGSAIILSTKAGQVARDGDGRNGTFTAALLRHIGEGASLSELFLRVQADVRTETKGEQVPQITSNGILADFYLGPAEASIGAASPAATDDPTPPEAEGSWIQLTSATGFPPRGFHSSLVYDDKLWVIGGENKDGSLNDVWYTADGIAWACATKSAPFAKRSAHTSVVFQNRMWIIAGGSGGPINSVWSSSDGKNWVLATNAAAFPARSRHASVVFDGKIWVIGGRTASGKTVNDAWFSSNGKTWTCATKSAAFSPRANLNSVVFDGKIWVIGGDQRGDGTGACNDAWYSSDGKNWTQASSEISGGPNASALALPGAMWYLNSGPPGLYSSSDGSDWPKAAVSEPLPFRYAYSGVYFKDRIWVIGGITQYEGESQATFLCDIWAFEPPARD